MNRTHDVVIVGSGAGGAAAAYRLTRAGLDVLLVEKGETLSRDGSTLDVERVVTRGEFLSRERWRDGAGRAVTPEEHFNLGGKTKWYGAALARYARHEFDADHAHQCPAWPIGYADLEPYYIEAERLLGVREFDREPDLARLLARVTRRSPRWLAQPLPMGLAPDILEDAHEAAHFDGFASVRDLKADAETALLSRIGNANNLTLLTGTAVETLIADPADTRRVVGVRTEDGRELHARAVLLAAGALHSPRLLQRYLERVRRSGSLPMAGRNLKLHLLTAMVAVGARRQGDLLRKTTLIVNESFPHSSVQPLGFNAELIARLVPAFVPRFVARQVAARSYGFFLQTEDGAHADNRVIDAPATGLPTLDYSSARIPSAEREHRRFTRAFQRALLGAGCVSLTQRIGLNGTAHAQGTLVAGSDAASSVVDTNGAVHGLESLYVVDGSVLPRSSRVNPSLTIYAWSLRVADLLARHLRETASVGERTAVTASVS